MPTQSSESIRFQCPGCQRTYRGPSRFLGKKLRCAGCQTEIFLSPAPPAEPAYGGLELAPPSPRGLDLASGSEERPSPSSRRARSEQAGAGRASRRQRIVERESRDPLLLMQLQNAANMALVWGVLGLMFLIPAFFALRNADAARYLARRMRRPVPGQATAGRLLAWWVLGSFFCFLLFLLFGFAAIVLGAPA
ncbi:MAG: hypothetical protein R3F62_25685 [Planctomycetota bacterium]